MKIILVPILILLVVNQMYGQFIRNEKKDAEWIKSFVDNETQLLTDEDKEYQTHVEGKVMYSADYKLRICQIAKIDGIHGISDYRAYVQYYFDNKLIEQNLGKNNDLHRFQFFPIKNIYGIKRANNSYLIISSKIEKSYRGVYDWLGDFFSSTENSDENYEYGFRTIHFVATLISLGKDSLTERKFIEPQNFSTFSEALNFESSSLEVVSNIKSPFRCEKPFFRFDTISQNLNILGFSCNEYEKDCDWSFANYISKSYEFQDSVFVLTKDSFWYCPSLESLNDTLKNDLIKIGNVPVKVLAVNKYEEIGESVLEVLFVDYTVNSHTIGFEEYNPEPSKNNYLPEYQLQKDSSAIVWFTSVTTPNARGECGGCEYNDTEIYHITKNGICKLFSYYDNSGSPFTTFQFTNEKNKNQEGTFYLNNDSTESWETMVDSIYWKNNSTQVFRIDNEDSFRNFYVHYRMKKGKIITKLEVGKIEKRIK